MKRYTSILIFVLLGILILLASCRPPEIEGLIVRIDRQMYDDETYQLAEDAIQNNPENAEAWFYYGMLQGRKGNFEKMNQAFDKCLALNPQQSVKDGGGQSPAKEAVKRLRVSYFADNFNSGKSSYDKARETDDPAKKKEYFEAAVEKFSAARRADPTRTEPLQPLAISMLLLGDTTAAVNTFEKAVALQSDNQALLLNAGDFYLQINRTDDAEEMYNRVLAANENNENAYLGLGQLETQKGNWDKATQFFEKAYNLNPENTNVAFNIGVSYYNQEKYQEAIPFLKRTLENERENAELYQILGICYVQSKMYDEGMQFLEQAVQQFPNNSELWNYLAIVYANKGMKEKAEEAMKKTKELENM